METAGYATGGGIRYAILFNGLQYLVVRPAGEMLFVSNTCGHGSTRPPNPAFVHTVMGIALMLALALSQECTDPYSDDGGDEDKDSVAVQIQ